MDNMNNDSILIEVNMRFTGVFVIQSLPVGEPTTGLELYNDIVSRYSEMKGFDSNYKEAYGREDFFLLLDRVVDAVLNKRHFPILHFEIHGAESGLGFVLASNELVTWKEFAGYCRQINVHLKNELMISLATCNGIQLYNAVDFRKPAPFWGIVGPKQTANNGELLRDFSQFYDLLISTKDIGAAVATLNLLDDGCVYGFLTSELLFDELKEYSLEVPISYAHLTRQQRRKYMKDKNHPLSGEMYWKYQKQKFLMLA